MPARCDDPPIDEPQRRAATGRSLDTAETAEERLGRYRETGDLRIRNAVIEDHRWLAVVIAKDYSSGSEPLDDLVQVAFLGVLKAAERFDPRFGVQFRTFAAITARGELRRYFRDSTWSITVPRRLQELRYEIRAANDVLHGRLRRSPTTNEVAEYLHVHPDEIIDCLCADGNFRALTLDGVEGVSDTLAVGLDDDAYRKVEGADAFDELVATLPSRLRRVVEMRFIDQMRQRDIAEVLGVSQVHVSRLLRAALVQLRAVADQRKHDEAFDLAVSA